MRWAVFDIDGTLIPHTSTERIFLKELLGKGLFPVRNALFFLIYSLNPQPFSTWRDALKANKMYLKGFSVQPTRYFARWLIQTQIVARLSHQGIETIRRKRQEGYRILFMSGAPDFLVTPLAEHLRADFYLASRLEIKNRHFTGRLSGLHPYGSGKTRLLRKFATRLEIDFSESVAYANHYSDVDHLALFGHPVAVNPGRKFQPILIEKNWPVEYWE